MNKTFLMGNLATDPEIKEGDDGTLYGGFRLATHERWNDKTTGERREETEFHTVRVHGGHAKTARDYLKKGQQVLIEGRIKSREYTPADGIKRVVTEILCRNIELLGIRDANQKSAVTTGSVRGGAGGSNHATNPPQQARKEPEKPAARSFREDIPF